MKRFIQIVIVMVILAGLAQPVAMATTGGGYGNSGILSINGLEKNQDEYFLESGTTELVSVASDGTQGNRGSGAPSISADGRYVVFLSNASNLVSDKTNNIKDVFVHDLQTGENERVSVASDGTEANDNSGDYEPHSISADGRYVAFDSFASNLVSGDTNECFFDINGHCPDVFVHDRQTGETERVSVASDGTQGNSESRYPSISDDGRYVAFGSRASNLVNGDTNECFSYDIAGECPDVFVHDRQSGVTERVSVASDGTQGNHGSYNPSISADGRYVAFQSAASNLVSGDIYSDFDIFVHDRLTGQTELVSVASNGSQGNSDSNNPPSISSDGRYVAFESYANNLVSGDTNECVDIFVHDRQTGETERVSVSSSGVQGNEVSWGQFISPDGRYVVFTSYANTLVSGDTNECLPYVNGHCPDAFVHDRQTGATELVSVSSDGTQGNDVSLGSSISADGRHVAFGSHANNLVVGDTNLWGDVFLRVREGISVGDVDLDVSNQTIRMAPYQQQIKQHQPFSTFLEVDVYNRGNNIVGNVIVQYFSGPPDTGSLLGSTVLSAIGAGSSETARFEWVTTSSPISMDVYVKVSSSQTDTNLNNNTTITGTSVYTAFANYEFDPDTFKFNNWPLTLVDFLAEWIIYATHFTPDLWRYIAGPYYYAKYAKGGHCYGISSASIIYWDTPLAKPFPIDTFDFELYQAALDLHDHHVRQIFTLETDHLMNAQHMYDEVNQRLNLPIPRPSLFAFLWESYHSEETGAHAVVAYKVVQVGNQRYIYVYDNEEPMTTTLGNEDEADVLFLSESSAYFDYKNQYQINQGVAIEPLRDPSEVTLEMIEDMADAVLRYLTSENHLQLFFSWTNITSIQKSEAISASLSEFLVIDDMGRKVGLESGVLVSEIPGAVLREFEGSYYLTLPADGKYSLMMMSPGIGTAQLSFAIPISDFQVQETVFTDFSIPSGAGATTSFSQTTTDWRIEIDGQADVLPSTNQLETLTSSLYLPNIVR